MLIFKLRRSFKGAQKRHALHCLPDLKSRISAYRRVTFWQQRQKVTKKRRPRSRRRSIAKEEARWLGALRFSLVAGSADRPSLA